MSVVQRQRRMHADDTISNDIKLMFIQVAATHKRRGCRPTSITHRLAYTPSPFACVHSCKYARGHVGGCIRTVAKPSFTMQPVPSYTSSSSFSVTVNVPRHRMLPHFPLHAFKAGRERRETQVCEPTVTRRAHRPPPD